MFDANQESYAKKVKGKTGLIRIFNAAKYSFSGLKAAYQNEAAFRQVAWGNSLLLISLFFIPFTMVIKMFLVFISFFSVIVELFNTGLEAAIDHTSLEKSPLAKIGKDVGSAAQMLALTLLVIIWLMALANLFL